MKKWMFLLACVFSVQLAIADNDKIIQFAQLPATAQQFVKKYFASEKVAVVKMDKELFGTTYEVAFINGDKVEFARNGAWKELKSRQEVPQAEVPSKIKAYVSSNYPGERIVYIERDKVEYEVKLSNRLEITFDTNFNVIDMDRDDD